VTRAANSLVHFRDAAGIWRTWQAEGVDTVPIECLGIYQLGLDAMYQDVLSA
jgi:hypothetical protein